MSAPGGRQHQLCTLLRTLHPMPLLIFVHRVESGLEQILVVPATSGYCGCCSSL